MSASRFLRASLLLVTSSAFVASSTSAQDGQGVQPRSTPKATVADLDFQTDLYTGRFGYSVPISLPPGRGGSAPDLNLSYSSGAPNGWCGVGWGLDVGQIQRDGMRGVPVAWGTTGPLAYYDDAKGFTFNLNGQGSRLVQTATGSGFIEYRAETDKAFLRFLRHTSGVPSWEVIDRSGTHYFFGENANSRMENPAFAASGAGGIYSWCLTRVLDVHGNQTTYTYTQDGNKPYLASLTYNQSVVGGGIPACFRVVFTTETRPDQTFAYTAGYRVESNRRLNRIQVYFDKPGSSPQTVREYAFVYYPSPSTQRSLLYSVTLVGTTGSQIQLANFVYSVQPRTFEPTVQWGNLVTENVAQTGGEWRTPSARYVGGSDDDIVTDFVDWDGDGRPDRLMRKYQSPYFAWMVQLNTGSGFNPNLWYMTGLDNDFHDDTLVHWNSIGFTNSSNDTRAGLWDLDGDGLVDRVMGDNVQPFDTFFWQKNLGNGLTPYVSQYHTTNPPETVFDWNNIVNRGSDTSPRTTRDLVDLNGDGKIDRINSENYESYGYWKVRLNTGTGFEPQRNWTGVANTNQGQYTPDWNSIAYSTANVETEVGLWDLNGDGLPDRVMRSMTTTDHFEVQFNNGAGFESITPWNGLVTGSTNAVWSAPITADDDTQAMFSDMNADGLIDRVTRSISGPYNYLRVQFNTGKGFDPSVYLWSIESGGHPDAGWSNPVETNSSGNYNQTRATMVDMDGDGLVDRVLRQQAAPFTAFDVELNQGPFPDLLTTVHSGLGGEVRVAYRPSSELDNKDHQQIQRLSFPVQVVQSITTDDGMGTVGTTNYNFAGGFYEPKTREFRGFHRAEETDPQGVKSVTLFHQSGGFDESVNGEWSDPLSHAKSGMPFRSELWGSNQLLYKVSINQVEEHEVSPGRWFPYVAQTVELDYEGTGSYRATAKRFKYDFATGNLLQASNFGQVTNVNPGGHTFTTACSAANPCTYQYYVPATTITNPDIIDKVARVILTDNDVPDPVGQGHRLRETMFTYAPTTGDMSSKSDWLDLPVARYITENYQYDAYGNLIQATDPHGIVKTVSYADVDGIHTHAVSTTIHAQSPPMDFVTTRVPDPRTGFDVSDTDIKGLVTETDYDAFFRIMERRIVPPGGSAIWKERADYNLGGIVAGKSENRIRQRTNDGLDAVDGMVTYVYYDGLGRVVQTRIEAETGASSYRVADAEYDSTGKPVRSYRPYFSTGSAFTFTPGGQASSLVEYDAIGRTWRTTPPSGDPNSPTAPETIVYEAPTFDASQWTSITTDAGGMKKDIKRDAFGRVKSVTISSPGLSSSVSYGYDLLGRLSLVQHDPTHASTMYYDSLGRKLGGTDPDVGTWTFTYDQLSQLTYQTDAKGQTIHTTYDDLGRTTSRSFWSGATETAPSILYTYDVSDDPSYTVFPGQLYKVVDEEGWEKNSYDVRGRLSSRTRYVKKNGKSYTFGYSYDDGDRVVETRYPRHTAAQALPGNFLTPKIQHTYDSAGHLLQIDRLQNATTSEMLFRAPSFDALDMPGYFDYGNGVRTTFSYHANSRRPSQTLTTGAGLAVLQNLNYAYDTHGQIVDLQDQAHSGSQSGEMRGILYDGLHRLRSYTRNNVTTGMNYDALCNITQSDEFGAGTYAYDAVKLHAVTSVGSSSYGYDANGNMTARGSQVLTYDMANRLTSVIDGSLSVSYGYDHAGQRLWRQKGVRTGYFIGNLYEERDGRQLCHVFAGQRRVCTFELIAANSPPPPQSPAYDPVFYYVHSDHLGSANVLTDRLGFQVQHYENKAYGSEYLAADPNAVALNNRFTDQPYDADTGLYFFSTRYYDARLGRFVQPDLLTPDPLDPFAHNRFTYALGNPMRYADPSGHFSFIPIIIGAILGGVTAAIQHEDIGQGMLMGAITGAFGQFGTVGRALGGAANAAIQGGNPLLGAGIGAVFGKAEFSMINKFSVEFQSDAGSLLVNVKYHATNQLARKMTARLAVHIGWDPMVFNIALRIGSEVGNDIAGSRVVPPLLARDEAKYGKYKVEELAGATGPGIFGIMARGWKGVPFDLIDITLSAQGLNTASSAEFFDNYEGAEMAWGHSLGAMDMANLNAIDAVPGSQLWGLPLAKAAPFGASVQLNTQDMVPFANGLVSWSITWAKWGNMGVFSAHSMPTYIATFGQ